MVGLANDMAFKLKRDSAHQVIVQERLFLTADQKRVVKEGDKEAAFLLAAAGQPIDMKTAKRLGLVEDEEKKAPARVTEPVAPQVHEPRRK